MSGPLDSMLATLRALEQAPEEVARDAAALLSPRMRLGRVEARGSTVAIVPGGRMDAFLSDAWAEDMVSQAGRTLARLGGSS